MSALCQTRLTHRAFAYAICACTLGSPLLRNLSCAGLLRARNGDIRSHVGAHLSVPKKWSKVCSNGSVQFELLKALKDTVEAAGFQEIRARSAVPAGNVARDGASGLASRDLAA